MRPDRRSLLLALGTVGLGGTVAYWQRRRLRRQDGLGDAWVAHSLPVPAISEPLSLSNDHVEAAFRRVSGQVEDLADETYIERPSMVESSLERARENLESHRPAEVTTDADRLDTLEAYNIAASYVGRARAGRYGHTGDSPVEAFEVARAELYSTINGIENPYRGTSLTRAVVQAAAADERLSEARSSHDRAPDYFHVDDESTGVAWETVAVGRQVAFDAAWLSREQRGPRRSDDLDRAFERLRKRTEELLDDVSRKHDGYASRAPERWRGPPHSRSRPAGHHDAGRLALAVREQAQRAVIAASLASLASLQDPREVHDVLEGQFREAGDLGRAKLDAVDAVEDSLTEVGTDPLARYLLAEIVSRIRRGDHRSDALVSRVNADDESTWKRRRSSAYLAYREAAFDARAVPDVVALVTETAPE